MKWRCPTGFTGPASGVNSTTIFCRGRFQTSPEAIARKLLCQNENPDYNGTSYKYNLITRERMTRIAMAIRQPL